MNIQRFGVPVVVAAGLHGALFLIMPDDRVEITPVEKPLVVEEIRMEPPPFELPEHQEPAEAAAAGGPRPLPTTPEVAPLDTPHPEFTVQIDTPNTTVEVDRRLDKVPSVPFGPGGDGRDPVGKGSFRGAVDLIKLDRTPRALAQPSPDYPRMLQSIGVGGSVTVEFVVDTTGRVGSAEAVKWTHREFVDPAVRAVMRWRFEPGTVGGRKVRFRMAVPIEFNAAE